MNTTSYYDKYPARILTAIGFVFFVTLIKTSIEYGTAFLSGIYLLIYATITGQNIDLLLIEATDTLNLITIGVADLILISILLSMVKKRRQRPIILKESLKRKPGKRIIILSMFAVFAVSLAGGLLTQGIINIFTVSTPEHIESLMEVSSPLSFEFLLTIVSVVLIAPLFEELLLRKVLLDGLLRSYKPATAIFISAIIFAVFHMNVTQGVYTLILGLYLAYLYYSTGSLWLVTVVHAINNLYAVGVRLFTGDTADYISLGLMVAGIVSFVVLIGTLRRNPPVWQALAEPEIEANTLEVETETEVF